MTTAHLTGDIRADEGVRLSAYQDGGGVWTIGVGHTGPEVHEGLRWTSPHCDQVLDADIVAATQALDHRLPWWRRLDDVRQDVVVNMAFNLGVAELCTWKRTLGAMEAGDYGAAAAHMLASEPWRSQVGARAARLATQMRTGRRPRR